MRCFGPPNQGSRYHDQQSLQVTRILPQIGGKAQSSHNAGRSSYNVPDGGCDTQGKRGSPGLIFLDELYTDSEGLFVCGIPPKRLL
jgi:hypothetical protein